MNNRLLHKAQRYAAWQKTLCLGLSLFLAAPILAREVIAIQSTAAQVRGADATINQALPTTNSGGAATLTVESNNGASNQRAIVQFDLSVLPNVAIKQALLIVHATASTTNGFPRTYGAYGLTSFFRESDVTWNTRVANLGVECHRWRYRRNRYVDGDGGGGNRNSTPDSIRHYRRCPELVQRHAELRNSD